MHEEKFDAFPLIKNKRIVSKGLLDLGKAEEWLYQQLENFNIKDIDEVFYAEWTEGQGFFAIKMV